ncbi:C13 family peptidase [Azonexus sp.]|jgi:hypothetical protein|uniref:C13 family peptidase n=1 Tax=Azonexus sp. TaxID=1872668 RepID=UPI00282D9B8B|nr:C13 family peptidase [Azonexus sp.]MDR1995382.1 C13 family peptidase [Azonexus sp.]
MEEKFATAAAEPETPETPVEKTSVVSAALRDLTSNLLAGLGFLFFRKNAADRLRASVPQIVWLWLLGVLLGLAYDFQKVGLSGEFNVWALPYLLWGMPLVLLCMWCYTQMQKEDARAGILEGMVAILALDLCIGFTQIAFSSLSDLTAPWFGEQANINAWLFWGIWWALFLWYLSAVFIALWRIYRLTKLKYLLASIILGIVMTGEMWFAMTETNRLWQPSYSGSGSSYSDRWKLTRGEAILYRQPELLEKTLAEVQPNRPDVPELYLIAFGGDAGQDVFLNEVLGVETLFKERFGTAGRSIVLVNNPATVLERPVASVTALERALKAVGSRMDQNKDVLFLFMTSHGSSEFHFTLSLWPFRFDELTPQRLRELLDASGIKNRVIVVSACYSGGFIEPLSDPHTLVISAARADRNSHGCSHEADWTFFGRAYFDEALRHTHSFTAAFEQARRTVETREREEDYTLSEPQMSEGEAIRLHLEAIERRLVAGNGPPSQDIAP